ncbi:MAG: hypothetical protein O7G87_21610 [bacterium]|nr:hypothetical protein [bacterium]
MAISSEQSQHADLEPASHLDSERGLTLRAAALGIGIVVFINLWVTYAETVVHASRLSLSFFQLPLLFIFLILLGVVNPLVKRLGILRPLSPSELLTIIAIGMVGAVVPASGIAGFLMGVISVPYYFATPENRWAEFYHGHLSDWMVPTNPTVTRAFYEGLYPGELVNWHAWVIPLIWWSTFICAILICTACLMIILRRQWVEHEKLVYPLAAVPLEMIEDIDPQTLLPRLMRSKMFWFGAAVAFALFAWNTLSWFYPSVPGIAAYPHAGYYRFSRHSPGLYIKPFQFYTIGFAYFADLQLLFSIWFFFALYIVENLTLHRLGYQIRSSTDSFSADPPVQAWKCFGALACLVLWRLWIARSHLRNVVLKALKNSHPIDDSREILTYRTCVLGLLLSLLYIFYFLHRLGMDAGAALMYMAAIAIIYLGIARVVSETGVAYAQATVTPQAFVMDLRGTHTMSGSTLTGLVLTYALIDYMRGLFTPGLAHVARLSDLIRGNKRALLLCVSIGVFAGLAASVWLTLHLAHGHGAYNFPRFPFFNGDPKAVYASTLAQMHTPKPPDPDRYFFFGVGLLEMGLLTALHYRFRWWPLHPIGLVLSASDNHKSMVLPVFIAWATKAILMRVGGIALYRRSKPLFLGLMVGYTLGVIYSFAIDAIWFPGQGHHVHAW